MPVKTRAGHQICSDDTLWQPLCGEAEEKRKTDSMYLVTFHHWSNDNKQRPKTVTEKGKSKPRGLPDMQKHAKTSHLYPIPLV